MRGKHRTCSGDSHTWGYDRCMGLPPRPKGRPLVRRAVVASVLASVGCDSGVKPAPDRKQVVAPQVAYELPPQVETTDPPQVEPPHDNPPPDELAVAPQVAYATGFTLLVLDDSNRPVAKSAVTVTLGDGSTVSATTDERGTAFFQMRIDSSIAVSIHVRGYQRVDNFQIDGDMHPTERVVLKKKAR